jgi:glycosyltransferase involved in cell wall biosynthesis
VFELRDLWPDSIVAVGAMNDTRLIRSLRRLEYFLYRKAARIVSVTQSFKDVLTANGIDNGKVVVVPNGVELETYLPGPKPVELENSLRLEGKFVAAYVGTIGMAHGLGTVLEAAEVLKHEPEIAFVLVGTGAEHAALAEQCARRGLGNVVFVGSVSKEVVREYWKLCDVALVLLRDAPLFAHVIPSKMFEAMAMERPIILGVRGESRRVLDDAGAGIGIDPENVEALVEAVRTLARDAALRASLGKSGRQFVTRNYDRNFLANTMLRELERCAAAEPG